MKENKWYRKNKNENKSDKKGNREKSKKEVGAKYIRKWKKIYVCAWVEEKMWKELSEKQK